MTISSKVQYDTEHERDGHEVNDVFEPGDVVTIVSADKNRHVTLSYTGEGASNPLFIASQVRDEIARAYEMGRQDQAREMRKALLLD